MTPWHGGKNPCLGYPILIKHRDGDVYVEISGREDGSAVDWDHDGSDGDIVEYVILDANWLYNAIRKNLIRHLHGLTAS